MALTPAERRQRGQLAALSVHSRGRTNVEPAQTAFNQRFLTQATAEARERGEVLTQAELEKRAEYLRRLYFTRLSFKAARARSARRQLREAG